MITPIRQRDRDAVIDDLKRGVVPRTGLHLVQVGRLKEIEALLKDIERIADGGRAFRIVIGEYGSGKTFFLNLVRAMARQKNLVATWADLTPDRRLYATEGQARALYAELANNLATRTKPEGGALPGIVEKFIYTATTESKTQGVGVDTIIHRKLERLSEMRNCYDFADVIKAYWRGHQEGNEQLKSDAIRWLRGEFTTKTDAKTALGVRTIVDDACIYDQIKLLSLFARLAGFSGLLICLDELVNLYKLSNKQAREHNYEQILHILNDVGSVEGLGFLLGGTPEFLTDMRRGLYSYEALRTRLEETTFAKSGLADYTHPVLRLSSLSQEDFLELLGKIRIVFAYGDEARCLVPEEALTAFMAHCRRQRIGETNFRKPRNAIKAFVGLLSLLEQHPDATWQALLGEVDIPLDNGGVSNLQVEEEQLAPTITASARDDERIAPASVEAARNPGPSGSTEDCGTSQTREASETGSVACPPSPTDVGCGGDGRQRSPEVPQEAPHGLDPQGLGLPDQGHEVVEWVAPLQTAKVDQTHEQMPPLDAQASSSELAAYDLDPRIQRWIYDSRWTELHEAQKQAIPLILAAQQDVIIAASTATGKTEAAFFPILTRLACLETPGIVLYISPLKALINDQWRRLAELTERLEIPVTPWHGDISQSQKTRFLKNPEGCLLITPESLEAILMGHGHGLGGLLAGLQYVVVDELHAFMGTERGKQLQSLLHRVEKAVGRSICRVALSATLGDHMQGAADFLRPGKGGEVALVVTNENVQKLRMSVQGVMEPDVAPSPEPDSAEEPDSPAALAVVDDLFRTLRGSNNLVFPNSRRAVEFYSDSLRRRCEDERVPNEFWPHHGNLSKDFREETEAALKQKERHASAICTSTLELGIDIGAVKSVVQIGAPPSVASLRQRLGRSGRRKGEPAILRCFAIERQLTAKSGLSDQLRESTVQTVAMIRLLIEGWYEPLNVQGLHASTLVQQLLSLMTQHGGLQEGQAWELLCADGPFSCVSKRHFLSLLGRLGEEEVIFRDATGLLHLAPKGERITGHYSFYAAFTTGEEYRIVTSGRTLGSMPVSRPLVPGSFLIFAGRRWRVVSVSQEDLVIDVTAGAGGSLPGFTGGMGATLHDRVREEMREVLRTNTPVPYLDESGHSLLREARENYVRLGLDRQWIRQVGSQTQILLWRGDRIHDTLLLHLTAQGFRGLNEGLCVSLDGTTQDRVWEALQKIAAADPIEPEALAHSVKNKFREKWDHLLPEALLDASFASSYLDLPGVRKVLEEAMEGE
jgi:ATP-dependent helicase Lhr and Lhr-like helicase